MARGSSRKGIPQMTTILCSLFFSAGFALGAYFVRHKHCPEDHCLGDRCGWVQRGIEAEIREECERQGIRYQTGNRWVM